MIGIGSPMWNIGTSMIGTIRAFFPSTSILSNSGTLSKPVSEFIQSAINVGSSFGNAASCVGTRIFDRAGTIRSAKNRLREAMMRDDQIEPKSGVVRDLIGIAKAFYDKSWLLGTSGNLSNLSARNPLRFTITASGTDKGTLSPKSFVEVELKAEGLVVPAKGSNLKPSGEAILHAVIYTHTNAGSIIHVHSPAALLIAELYSQSGEFAFKELEVQKGLGFADISRSCQIPIFSNRPALEELARDVSSKISADQIGFLIKNHGLFVWGKTAADAKRHTELIHHVFECELIRRKFDKE